MNMKKWLNDREHAEKVYNGYKDEGSHEYEEHDPYKSHWGTGYTPVNNVDEALIDKFRK